MFVDFYLISYKEDLPVLSTCISIKICFLLPCNYCVQLYFQLASLNNFVFLHPGSVVLDLNRIPKPVKNPKNCVLGMLATDRSVPTLNLFKNKRCRGWWPMFAKGKDEMELVVSP